MKWFLLASLVLIRMVIGQTTLDGGRAAWSAYVRWGGTTDSTGSLLVRGQSKLRDSAGTWRAVPDSCSKPIWLSNGTRMHNTKLELAYQVRTSSGNTDSSQAKLRADTRDCSRPLDSTSCDSWVPAGRFKGDTSSIVIDSLITVATSSGTTWKPTRQLIDVPGGAQIRFCLDGYATGTSATDSTFFRKFYLRTSAIKSGGTPPSSVSISGSGLATSANQTGGAQKTQIVDGSGNVIASTSNNLNVQCANCSGSGASAADEASFTAGTSSFAPGGLFFQTTATNNPLTSGQQGMLQGTAQRAAFVNPRNSSGTEIGTSGAPFRVDPTGTTTQPVSGTVTANAGSGTFTVSGTVTANAGTNLNTSALVLDATVGRAQGSTTSGQTGPLVQGAVTTSAPSYTTAQTSPLSLTTAGALRTDASATTQPVSGTVTANAGSGTFATNVTQLGGVSIAVNTGTSSNGTPRVVLATDQPTNTNPFSVQGAGAHGASISGNPVRAGLRGISSDITAVTGGQTTDWVATVDGKAVNMPYAIQGSRWKYVAAANGLVTTSGVTAKAAGGAGIRNCVVSGQVINENGTTSTEVELRDGASGTVMWRGWAQAGGGGAAFQFPVPVCGTANTLVEVAENTATATNGVIFNLQGYTSAE